MSENEKPLKWLRKQDGEWEWAANYLRDQLDAEYMSRLKGNALTRFSTYENVVAAIRQIQEDRLDLVIRLQGAIRQRRYRSDSNGRKPLTFTLTKETITTLNSIVKRVKENRRSTAERDKVNETAVITALIEKEGQATEAERDYEKQLKESVSRERKIAAQAAASMTAQRDEALKHAERYLKLLAQWELAWPDEKPPAASEEEIAKIVEPRMKDLKDALAYIAVRDDLTTERPK
ncbi:TPA: hypothetical protein NHP39_000149 [Pseudomonas aeruginosa]|uniref:hypothetical protein n=1 Tax=Pseudomonas aeruginosa TaxID=287 RepID=UPI000F526177|nr:hypothetical protein [Pseudomonas aeruginosa]MBH9296370.1 hypothetical protein [Pseudomonas aeruginosa]RPN75853.1 hypothetical protein IPC1239_13865 [Pseudomonas aeruginosa]HBN8410733.1 hypothetical protein [Pseudomonas aeruginosa]HBN9541237.1 hypothetical protein [Pseudomonas aeruginosa]HBN9548126.1 hypothetical protein [Pseudomonas aeruginosa]